MGAFLDHPETTKDTEEGSGGGLRYAVASMQGWRVSMEDAHVMKSDIPGLPGHAFFGVFDGHAGDGASKRSAEGLLARILEAVPKTAGGKPTPKQLEDAMRTGFIEFDAALKATMTTTMDSSSGTTAITCFVTPTHIVVANCGDSRAVMARGNGEVWGSVDHKPASDTELERIHKAGGFVAMGRVNGTLAVSRALGDFDFKKRTDLPPAAQQVSPEPTCTSLPRQKGDQFVVLCCDGIWDVFSNEEVVEFVRQGAVKAPLVSVAGNLLDECLSRNSRDNMTACIVAFPDATVATRADGDAAEGGTAGGAAGAGAAAAAPASGDAAAPAGVGAAPATDADGDVDPDPPAPAPTVGSGAAPAGAPPAPVSGAP